MSDEFSRRTPCCGAPNTKPGPCWKERPGLSFEGTVIWHLPTAHIPETVRECTFCEATWLESDRPEDEDTDEDGAVFYGYANADPEDEDSYQW